MAHKQNDPWRFPTLERLGSEFERLERVEHERVPRSRFPRLIAAPGAAIVMVVTLVLLLESGGPAGARSIINEAPYAAIRSRSVDFRSNIVIASGSRQIQRFSQAGEIDFATASYRATLYAARGGEAREWRTVEGVFYVRNVVSGAEGRWAALRLTAEQTAKLASSPDTDAVTDPLALLRVLSRTRAPVARLERGVIAGVPVTRYRAHTTLASILRLSDSTTRPSRVDRGVAATIDVWLDRGLRPVQIVETLTGPASRTQATMRAVISFSGYGHAVQVRAPRGVKPTHARDNGPPTPLVGGPSHVFERLIDPAG